MTIQVKISIPAATLAAKVRQAAAEGLNRTAHLVSSEAVELAPIDKGDLRSSLTAGTIEATPDHLEARIGTDLPYAWRQHEELGWNHPQGGQAKYLEIPALAAADSIGPIMTQAVKEVL